MKTKKQSSHQLHKHADKSEAKLSHRKRYAILIVITLMVLAAAGWLFWFYNERTMPNVVVGNIAVGNATPDTIRQAIGQQAPQLRVTFDNNGKKTIVPAKDLGVVVDTEATVQKALQTKNPMLWQSARIPLVLTNDPGVLIEYAHQAFPALFVDAKDPEVVWNEQANQFEVKPGVDGKGLDIKSFEEALPSLAQQPQGFTLKLTTAAVRPLLDEAKVAKVRDEANNIVKQQVEFKLKGQTIYTAAPADIANWIHFVPEPTKGTARLEVDKAKVSQLLTDKVSPMVASPPVDQKVIVSESGAKTIIQQGKPGATIQDIDKLSGDVTTQLQSGKSFSSEVSIATAPFKTVTLTGADKWIEVDLSKQRVTMYLDDQPVKSVLVSTGRANTPTQVGTFAVYSKRAVMTMTGTIAGDYYYIPNIKWVSFFDGGEAFHGTYWHHNFGHPMSHGCVNMTEADAKTLYDFAPIGTKVVVHY